MGSHDVTCHPTEMTFPPLLWPKLVLYLATTKGRKAELVDRPGITPATNNRKSDALPLHHRATVANIVQPLYLRSISKVYDGVTTNTNRYNVKIDTIMNIRL